MYIQYDVKSTKIIKTFKTMSAAKAAVTRASNKWHKQRLTAPKYAPIATEDPQFTQAVAASEYYYSKIEKQVKRKNLMTGKEYTESVNTPNYMSPASEAYWSM